MGDRTDNQLLVPTGKAIEPTGKAIEPTGKAIEPTSKANLKKQGKFRANGSVTAESVLQGHQQSVKLARPE
ncbi:hypothetical protein [Microcoleus sp. N9_A1]|uniref:hypothetical protein n=1 Tax=Microcoleus sp. N9_A1 TaxID=3055380 RepID=UPI002FD19B57